MECLSDVAGEVNLNLSWDCLAGGLWRVRLTMAGECTCHSCLSGMTGRRRKDNVECFEISSQFSLLSMFN